MKLVVLAISIFSLSAHASYFGTFCSNSTGTVKWNGGHTPNTLILATSGREDQSITLPIHSIKMTIDEKMTVKYEDRSASCMHSSTSHYVAKVVISGITSEAIEAFSKMGKKASFDETVICTHKVSGRTPCQRD